MKQTKVEYEWLIDSRAALQRLLVEILFFLQDNPQLEETGNRNRSTVSLFVGAGYSLWRAAFLVDATREDTTITSSAQDLLAKVVAENTITFQDDRRMRNWTVGYYLNNARHRIDRIIQKKLVLDATELSEFKEFTDFHAGSFDPETDSRRIWGIYLDALNRAFVNFRSRVTSPEDSE